MNKYIFALPFEIQMNILSYTYLLQDKKLLDDIKSYKSDLNYIISYYKNNKRFIHYEIDHNILLSTDLFNYCNNNGSILSIGYYDKKFIEIINRSFHIKNNNLTEQYIFKIQFDIFKYKKQIKIIWSLLSPDERKNFIIKYCKNNNHL